MGSGATTDPEKLKQVAEQLARAAGAKPKRRLPVVNAADAAGLVAMMHAQLDTAIERRAEAAAANGVVIACTRGCTACCKVPVVVTEAEAAAVAVWLAQPEHADERARFLAAYPAWRTELGSSVEEVIATQDTPEKPAAFTRYVASRTMCPFNHDGDCSIYTVRPSLCRTHHVVGTSEQCSDPNNVVEGIIYPEVTDTYDGQASLRDVLHAALRSKPHPELLPKAVMRRLVRSTAFPNQPCPCGSGQKFKSCCRPE